MMLKEGDITWCSAYSVCDGERCIRNIATYGGFWMARHGGVAFAGNSKDNISYEIGYFETLGNAKFYIVTKLMDRSFGRFIVPNNDVADAQGYSMYGISTIGGKLEISKEYSSLICSLRFDQ
jgi:hypothetical protein